MKTKDIIISVWMFLVAVAAQAQNISIGGNVYGGGNAGDMTGNTSVTVRAGDFHNVYGGARMANVGGSTFVNVDGKNASDFVIIDRVYGGNDIAGTIGTNEAGTKAIPATILEHEGDLTGEDKVDNSWDAVVRVSTKTEIEGTGADEHVVETDDAKKIYIGQVFGGGNGEYDYAASDPVTTGEGDEAVTTVTHTISDKTTGAVIVTKTTPVGDTGFSEPVLGKAYLEICGGSIVYAFGGGNAATVTENTVICVDNPSKVVNHINVDKTTGALATNDTPANNVKELLDNARFKRMGIYGVTQGFTKPSSDEFQIGRLFGGNNKAEMAIMPKWNLLSGKVRNLYSGGNEGHMVAENGIFLEIRENSQIIVDNLFGGCRKADVNPKDDVTGEGVDHVFSPSGYNFPNDFAARVIVRGGDVNNVYGGNDISGKVHFGSAVGIYADVRGDIYGGGNGYYAYTDNPALENDPDWGDYYYPKGQSSVDALNNHRPNAEQVSIRIAGKMNDDGSMKKKVVIGGSVYVGGNCATLKPKEGYPDPKAELKIGSYILVNKVFLGNNGENMVDPSPNGILETYAGDVVDANGVTRKFSTLDLAETETASAGVFAKYMDGVTMESEPSVTFDNYVRDHYPDYKDYTATIGSFYCGGNVGSMRNKEKVSNINFDHNVIIFDKLVGGCNSANVDAHPGLNVAYQGGLIGDADADGNKLILNLSGLKIQPKRWVVKRKGTSGEAYDTKDLDEEGNVQYELDANGQRYLEWNVVDNSYYDAVNKKFREVPNVTEQTYDTGSEYESVDADINRRLFGGNIYGGCYDSGIVNGNVVININSTIVDRDDANRTDGKDYGVFDSVVGDSEGEAILYASDQYKITKRRTGVILDEQGMDVLGQSLNVFGGGHGKDTEIWGSTTINLNAGYTFQIFGGSEEGIIGKPTGNSTANDGPNKTDGTYTFNHKTLQNDSKYSCYVNVKGTKAGVSKQADHSPDMAEAEFIYGGGFFGPIAGNTVINLGKGRVFNSFAGSCNADILGHTETYVGRMPNADYQNIFPKTIKALAEGTVAEEDVYAEGFPWIRDIVYGGNDLGGEIFGRKDFMGRVSDFAKPKMYTPAVSTDDYPTKSQFLTTANAYVEYLQGRADAIFGGCYGTYDYKKSKFKLYTYTEGESNIPTGKEPGDPRVGVYFTKPRMDNAFVNFRPAYIQNNNIVKKVYGAGQGQSGEKERDILQNRSYVLVDIPSEIAEQPYYHGMEVLGAGAWGGVGMGFSPEDAKANPDAASAVIDLMRGKISAAYGGSFKEGITRRTVVNVPAASTINIANIFGGACGYIEEVKDQSNNITLVPHNEVPCDVYEAIVNFSSENAFVTGGVYGGNNACRRTIFSKVNINSTVHSSPKDLSFHADVYGAGYGKDSWSHYTEVNLNENGQAFYVYGGGNAGKVLNDASFHKWIDGKNIYSQMGDYSKNAEAHSKYMFPSSTNPIISAAEYDGNYYNTNVHVYEGGTISGYGFGGGYGADAVVSGTAYLDILGGTAMKDISGSGRSGDVKDLYGVGAYEAPVGTNPGNPDGFTASTMVYVRGGTARNVYASGWRGSVGKHDGLISASATADIDGEANVVIGKVDGTNYMDGIPAITRNVYGGGEGGSVFGKTNVTINNGYIGYRYEGAEPTEFHASDYVEELLDGDQSLEKGGNVFGGGYVANSYVDCAFITMYGGQVRGSLFGGGEIGPIGRGSALSSAPTGTFSNDVAKIYKGGETHIYLYGGHVMRNVFGGGRGYDNWGGDGTKMMSSYMTEEELANLDLSSKGFVFGSTDVHIRGGEIGTADNAIRGYGNVFGGGDEGFVYSSMGEKKSDGNYRNGTNLTLDCNVVVEPYCLVKPGHTASFDDYKKDTYGNILFDFDGINGADPTGLPIKDAGKTISFTAGKYVPTEYLLQLKNKTADVTKWGDLYDDGVTIHNAVFAGGNIATGSDIVAAETPTVFGNAAASLRDVYNRDLISVGTDDIGGLYGDGNLTLVDGFRELHVDNYGTDFYNLSDQVLYEQYDAMSQREKDYYQLRFVAKMTHTYTYRVSQSHHNDKCNDKIAYKKGQKVTPETWAGFCAEEQANWKLGTKTYTKDDQIEDSEWALMDPEEQEKWRQDGVFSKYAGRPLNTLQRADLCGVYGSRIVLRGAQDRASEEVDYNDYTINRVNEVSLNQRRTLAGDTDSKNLLHGNYFGIYNTVKFLGNLTSDVRFADERQTDISEDGSAPAAVSGESYFNFKKRALVETPKYRNNGTSFNKVALASGVYLEIKREEGEKTKEDVWGYITGVVELDLINVMQGMGGGYVYAKNEHGTKNKNVNQSKNILLNYNMDAATFQEFNYNGALDDIETSGNFVHNTKQIVDDCYPNSGIYNDGYVKSPAHYWFIRGSIYVYDQKISAYTGVANAYAEKVELPLTIAAASNGRMTLREVQPNYYAYYDKNGIKLGVQEEKLIVNNNTYTLNDPISYWDYRLLSDADKEKFVEETYVVIDNCVVDGKAYVKGEVMLPDEYDDLSDSHGGVHTVTFEEGGEMKTDPKKGFDYFFRLSNNLSHDEGFILTYDVNNPMVWDNYYTKTGDPTSRINTKLYNDYKEGRKELPSGVTLNDFTEGPTYSLKEGVTEGVFGQREYKVGELVNYNVYHNYNENIDGHVSADGQAKVEAAWIVTSEVSIVDAAGHELQRLYPGTTVTEHSQYPVNSTMETYSTAQWDLIKSHAEVAKVCTKLLKFSTSDYIFAGQALSSADIATLKSKIIEMEGYETDASGTADAKATAYLSDYISNAYQCYEGGLYGGKYFAPGQAYRALDTWCSLSAAERAKFNFNYDAFDVLIDPTYSDRLEDNYGKPKIQYDGYEFGKTDGTPLYEGDRPLNPKLYSVTKPVDYKAEFKGYKDMSGETELFKTTLTYTDKTNTEHTITAPQTESQWLSREDYEAIPNERHHFSPIDVKEPRDYYVVNEAFIRGDVPYSVGQVIDPSTYESLNPQQKTKVDVFDFTAEGLTSTPRIEDGKTVYDSKYYFYCREPYQVNEKGEGSEVTTVRIKKNGLTQASKKYELADSSVEGDTDDEVDQGVIIDQGQYNDLPNKQLGFIIHGTSPTETSTLYVSSGSDINDLSKEKIITVIYLYEYEESDALGKNVTPVSERHIVNIHINFESGVPQVGELRKPDIVYPGTTIGLEVPTVDEGAYKVTDSGWELFYKQSDADTHTNGIPYQNNVTPVYWYQNNYWIAYYAKTDLGKTYSNAVQISVANAQDLKAVMNDKEHHYYIDHKDVDYAPKIYINNYETDNPATSQNGVQLLKDLYDLSLLNAGNVSTDDETGLIDEGAFVGHGLLNERVKAGDGLDFILRADLDGTPASTSSDGYDAVIAGKETGTTTDSPCFAGYFHGDGHYISGLNKSLFGNLCGNVYNLGVMGSFTGAGIAETGSGYVENCWVSTTSTAAKTSKPVFGEPTGLSTGRPYRIVNCYYQEEDGAANPYTNHSSTYGIPTKKPKQAFYNGEVAYDLNGFYLFKRYADGSNQTTGGEHKYYTLEDVKDPAKTTSTAPRTAYYGTVDASLSSAGMAEVYSNKGYVEDRFADGDFRYADCVTIPKGDNPRAYKYMEGTIEKTIHYPVWPDDYIFFGQNLSYGHIDGRDHQDVPSSIVRDENGYVETEDAVNRVYRAPAYFRSKEMKTAYFNPDAIFAQTKKGDATTLAYKNMTAIDFTDARFGTNDTYKVYDKGDVSVTFDDKTTKAFYPPLLDDDGLTGFQNIDLTANLLVYTGALAAGGLSAATTAAQKTAYYVSQVLGDAAYQETQSAPIFNDGTDLNADPYRYHTVEEYDYRANTLRGHWVQKKTEGYIATLDHLLLDRQDFNAPISYTFDDSHRMWYQREPDKFVDRKMGWEAVSLPFSAELVTTQQKGEITHFFSGSQTSKNGTDTKIGHEYWLREFDKTANTLKEKTGVTGILEGNFKYPSGSDSGSSSETILKKEVTNTFLWDYYYQAVGGHNQKDMNKDTYQTYYSTAREYTKYPMLTHGIPYIIGFPGTTYYEFDLSGNFQATTTAAPYPTKLDKQIITFASQKGATIGVSDDEMAGVENSITIGSPATTTKYTFKPSYLNESFAAGSDIYTLQSEYDSDNDTKADCSSFVKIPATGETLAAFRPYFMSKVISGARPTTRAIVFNNDDSQLKGVDDHGDLDSEDPGKLKIYAGKHKIIVESALTRDIEMRIVNAAGITMSTFTLEPGETVETRIINAGVYIVQSTDGRYIKKLAVK